MKRICYAVRHCAVWWCMAVSLVMMVAPPQAYGQNKTIEFKVGVLPILEHLPAIVASEEFELSGGDAQVSIMKYFSWIALQAAFRTGSVDAILVTPPVAFMMFKDGVRAQIVAVASRNGYSLVLKGTASKEALMNKTIGLTGNDTMDYLLLYKFLQQQKLALGYDVESVLIPLKKAVAALEEEKIYGFLLPEPYGQEALLEKAGVQVALSKDLLPNHIGSVILVKEDLIKNNPALVRAWLKTIVQAAGFIETDKARSSGRQTAVIAEKVLQLPQSVTMEALTTPADRIVFRDVKPEKNEFKQLLDLCIETRVMEESINLDALLNDSLLE